MINLLFAVDACAEKTFFGLVPWYHYLERTPDKNIDGVCNFTVNVLGADSSIPLILLAIIDDLLRIAGLVAVAFVIYGAIKYTTSEGNPDQANSARHTIINALVGLVVAMVAVGFVSFIGNSLK